MNSANATSARRLIAVALIALVILAVSVVAGRWQWGRYEARADAVDSFAAARQFAAVPISELFADGALVISEEAEWRLVTVSGAFDEGSETTLRNRSVNGVRASEYVVWFEALDGRSLLVLAGWDPVNAAPSALTASASTDGTITVLLRALEQDDGKDAGTSISRIALDQVVEPRGRPISAYGMLTGTCAESGCLDWRGEPVPPPHLTKGPHLAYAFQWYVFAALAPIGAVLLLRRDRADPSVAPSKSRANAKRSNASGRLSDEEIEDAL